jgi:hypothetical protein
VVVGVAEIGLQQVVIDVLRRDLGPACATPSCSNSSITIVPVVSCVSVWSIRSAISPPGVSSPSSRCEAISL